MKRVAVFLVALGLLWFGWDRWDARLPSPLHQAEWLQAGDVRIRTVRAGQGDTTLLLLHGFGESLMGVRLIFDRLARHYRVVAVDLPGFGASEKPDRPYDLPVMEARLSDFLRRWLRPPVVLVGHSMGGELAAAIALANPDRVTAVVLIDPAGYGLNPALSDSAGQAIPEAAWVAGALPYVLPIHDPLWLAEPAEWADYDPAADSAYQKSTERVLKEFDFAVLRDRYSELEQPTLLIWGRLDTTIPLTIGQSMANLIPCDTLVVLPQAMHRPHQSDPDRVAAEIEHFLREGIMC